ncbi:MAG: outer membrane lipid asymmetry maintenance protein MlaD [Thermodesulfovibrionales bacterium]
MNKISIETAVGIFIIIGFLCLVYISLKLGDVQLFASNHYIVKARFTNISGLKEGSGVEIAGVPVGKVSKIILDNDQAVVELLINPGVKIQEDSIASIRTQGIIGDKYIKISPGGSEEYIKPNGFLSETESTVDIEELISKYIFEKKE